jgi:hypothetical protein
MHAVGLEGERRLHVVVHNERDARRAHDVRDEAAALHDVGGRQTLQTELDDRRPSLGGGSRDLCVLDDAVQLHASSMFARLSSSSGVSA